MSWFTGQSEKGEAVRKVQMAESSSCPVAKDASSMPDPPPPTCPVSREAKDDGTTMNGYVNPRNFMPNISQAPLPTQRTRLPTHRTTSSIPKSQDPDTAHEEGARNKEEGEAGPRTGSTNWEYPSPQQFFNAVQRKGFTATQERDVPAMVSIHNAVNERAWQEILAWERATTAASCGGPKLVQFRGDASVVTPKARVLGFVGYARPFDTHFWTVDRCGEKVEYVIDFYKGKQQQQQQQQRVGGGSTASGGVEEANRQGVAGKLEMPSFYLDVRPAGIQGFPARIKRAMGL